MLQASARLTLPLRAGALSPEPGADADAAGVMEVVYDDTHPDRLLVLGAAFHNWISTDFGKTFSRVCLAGTQQLERTANCETPGMGLSLLCHR